MRLRVVKLAEPMFLSKEDIIVDFEEYKKEENVTLHLNNQIRLGSLDVGDIVIFSYKAKTIYYGICSEKITQDRKKEDKYDMLYRYFSIYGKTLRQIPEIKLKNIQDEIRSHGFYTNLLNQGWSNIEDESIIRIILNYIGIEENPINN